MVQVFWLIRAKVIFSVGIKLGFWADLREFFNGYSCTEMTPKFLKIRILHLPNINWL